MRENEKIPVLSESERKESIKFIIQNGMPEKQSLISVIPDVFRSVGLRGLFFGVSDCVYLALLASAVLWLCILSVTEMNSTLLYVLFAASPFLYASLHFLTSWKEMMNGTYELMMTFRCSLKQLTVLRMLVFGSLSVVLSVLLGAIVGAVSSGGIPLLRSLSISFSSLFLFASLQIVFDWRLKAPFCRIITPVIWIGLCVLLFVLDRKSILFLSSIPTAVFWIIAAVSLSAYVVMMKRYYFDAKEGALDYVIG